MFRTHTCAELAEKNIDEKITLSGWVHSRRDHGGIIFIDLRDRHGITQITLDPSKAGSLSEHAEKLRSEWVIKVTGIVIARPDDMVNKKIPTGSIEIDVAELEILNTSEVLPFQLNDEKAEQANEGIRLKYRYLDLRRKRNQKLLMEKARFIAMIRNYFTEEGFVEVQTPILTASSPEGARDWLVPSRLYPGEFYAVQQQDIFDVMEPIMKQLTESFSEKKMDEGAFVQIPWTEAMTKYGSDKPDLRFGMEIQPISEIVKDSEFGVFAGAVKDGGVVHAMRVEGGASFSRSEIDKLTELAQSRGAKGLAYIIVKEGGELQSPIVKFLGDGAADIISHVGAVAGDIVFFGADAWRVVCESLGAVRNACGEKLDLKDPTVAKWAWIVDFPMYDFSEIENGRIDFSHNPFSMPQGGMEALETKDPLDILGYQYDLILNGLEISSGAVRNHRPDIMYKAFEIAGYSKEDVDAKFGHMIEAFAYGAPPHGGNAPGIDRLFMELNDCDSIRDIYAFPKDGQGRDAMMNAPSKIEGEQLNELHIKIKKD